MTTTIFQMLFKASLVMIEKDLISDILWLMINFGVVKLSNDVTKNGRAKHGGC